jgi:predicted transcriptional regulator
MELMKVKVCFDIEEEDIEEIDKIAEDEQRSRSFILREAVKKYIKTL